MRVVNTDAVSYLSKTLEKRMDTAQQKKKIKYLNDCLNEHRRFTPLVALVDVHLGVEVEATLKHISIRLAQKWQEPYSHTFG